MKLPRARSWRLLLGRTKTTRDAELELGQLGQLDTALPGNDRDTGPRLVDTIFDWPAPVHSSFPGLLGYDHYLQSKMSALLAPLYAPALRALHGRDTTSALELQGILAVVAGMLRTCPDAHLCHLVKEATRRCSSSKEPPDDQDRKDGVDRVGDILTAKEEMVGDLLLVIASWVYPVLDVTLVPSCGVRSTRPLELSVFRGATQTSLSAHHAYTQSIAAVVAGKQREMVMPFGSLPFVSAEPRTMPSNPDAVFEAACLDLPALQDLGQVHIVWVSDLQSHLDFEPREKRLAVFRFPSYCMASLSMPPGATVYRHPYHSFLDTLHDAHHDGEHTVHGMHGMHNTHGNVRTTHQLEHEILQSYRLLFAQNATSRNRAAVLLRGLQSARPGDPCEGDDGPTMHDTVHDREYDTLLDVLCTRSDTELKDLLSAQADSPGPGPASAWPAAFIVGRLQKRGSYPVNEFPLLAPRLQVLQQHIRQSQPTGLLGIWRDGRSPPQWYAFWVVLMFGAISVALGVLQLIVSVAQLTTQILLPQ